MRPQARARVGEGICSTVTSSLRICAAMGFSGRPQSRTVRECTGVVISMSAEYRNVRVRVEGSVSKSARHCEQVRETWTPGTFRSARSSSIRSRTYSSRRARGRRWPVTFRRARRRTSKSQSFFPGSRRYEIYLSTFSRKNGWAYSRGEPFLRILVEAASEGSGGQLRVLCAGDYHRASLRLRRIWAAPKLFASPLRTIAQNIG